MQCKLFQAATPKAMEEEINGWLIDCGYDNAKIFIHNVQQYTIGEVTPLAGLQQMPGQPPNIKYTLCLLIFYTVSEFK
jgi:hypothetical protein